MVEYYCGGYLLLHCLPAVDLHPQLDGKIIMTCSTCFNESLFGAWAYSWANHDDTLYDANMAMNEHLKSMFNIDDSARKRIHIWADEAFTRFTSALVSSLTNMVFIMTLRTGSPSSTI